MTSQYKNYDNSLTHLFKENIDILDNKIITLDNQIYDNEFKKVTISKEIQELENKLKDNLTKISDFDNLQSEEQQLQKELESVVSKSTQNLIVLFFKLSRLKKLFLIELFIVITYWLVSTFLKNIPSINVNTIILIILITFVVYVLAVFCDNIATKNMIDRLNNKLLQIKDKIFALYNLEGISPKDERNILIQLQLEYKTQLTDLDEKIAQIKKDKQDTEKQKNSLEDRLCKLNEYNTIYNPEISDKNLFNFIMSDESLYNLFSSFIEYPPTGKSTSYCRKDKALNNTEHKFYKLLYSVINSDQYIIQINSRMIDIIDVGSVKSRKPTAYIDNKEAYEKKIKEIVDNYKSRIIQKHIDFTIVKLDTSKPVMCIELDGPSHYIDPTYESLKSQVTKDMVFSYVRLPLLRLDIELINKLTPLDLKDILNKTVRQGTVNYYYTTENKAQLSKCFARIISQI